MFHHYPAKTTLGQQRCRRKRKRTRARQ